MTKQIKYPIEAFALAAVLFSTDMKTAMIVGIGLIFGHVLQCVLGDFCCETYKQTISVIGAAVTCGALYLMLVLTGMAPDIRQILGLAVLALLLVKHQDGTSRKCGDHINSVKTAADSQGIAADFVDYNQLLFADAWAYGIYVLWAVIREYLTGATIFGCTLPELGFISATFGKPMFALIGAGLAIALINRLLKSDCDANAALWVCIPVILLETPFVWNNVPEWAGMIIGIATVGVVYVTLRKKLAFSATERQMEGIPVELVMLGITYMIFGLL